MKYTFRANSTQIMEWKAENHRQISPKRHQDGPSTLSFALVGLKIAVGLRFLLSYAYDIYYLRLLWLVGIAAYLFAMILFDEPENPDGQT